MNGTPSRIRAAVRGDLPEIVELLNACDVAETGQPDTTSADVEGDWGLEGFSLANDTWVAEGAGGRLAGYAYAGDQYRTGELEADVWVHPQDAEAGLAGRLLGLAERRAAQLAAERGYAEPRLDVFSSAADAAKRDLLRRHGFAPRRTVWRMAVDLGDRVATQPAPAGVFIRAFRPQADEHVMYDTMMDAFAEHYRHSDEPFDAWRARLLGREDFDPGLWFLAWEGGAAVGGLIAYDHGDLGWVRGLGVRRRWRRRGIGGALLTHAFAEFVRRGQTRVELGVDAEGETRPLRVYERAGMRLTLSYELYEKRLRP